MGRAPGYCHSTMETPLPLADFKPWAVPDACCVECGDEVKVFHPHSAVVICSSCGQEQFILRAIEAAQTKKVSA